MTTLTHEQRLSAAIGTLVLEHELAVTFHMGGASIVGEDDLNRYQKTASELGTDRWVGACPGSEELGGVYWCPRGTLRHRRTGDHVNVVHWSFNHTFAELPGLLVQVFTEHGLAATWDGGYGCVELPLDGER